MYYNGKRGYHVSTFVKTVHDQMFQQYVNKSFLEQENAQAKDLQTFFQTLQDAARTYEPGQVLEDEGIQLILEYLQTNLPNKRFKISALFRRTGGIKFEQELTDIYEAIWNQVSLEEFERDKVHIGSDLTGIDLSEEIIGSKQVQKILKETGTRAGKAIKNKRGIVTKKFFSMPEVQGKTDVQGYETTIKADANPTLLKYYNLLKDATFSAKNYKSVSWRTNDNGQKEQMVQEVTNIHLGKSSPFRAIVSTLRSLNYDEETSVSAFYSGFHKAENDPQIGIHFYHLRYAYELAGLGQRPVVTRFLIYNDPSTDNIFVKSTAQIISDVLQDETIKRNVYGEIFISSKKFSS